MEQGTVYKVDFQKKELEFTYHTDYQLEQKLKDEIARAMIKATEAIRALYAGDRQFLEWFDRQAKTILYRMKES